MQADGDSEPDVKRRISKASQAFSILKNIWKSKKLSRNTKIRIFRSNVVSVLLYGCESWKVATTISRMLEVFQNRCLRRILNKYRIASENVNLMHYDRSQAEKMDLDWTRNQKAVRCNSKDCIKMDTKYR